MYLTIDTGSNRGRSIEVSSGLLIGRDDSCDIAIDDEKVSRRHAHVSVQVDGTVLLQDLGSRNGTFVDGQRIEAPVTLRGTEHLRFGSTVLVASLDLPRDSEGSRLGLEIGAYRLEAKIAEGAMGAVYLAEHVHMRRKVALKVLSRRLFRDQRARERFVEESRAAGAIEHPNVIPVYDAGGVTGEPFIAMRYVAGEDLGALLLRRGRLELEETLALLGQVAAALDAAHTYGLVHRDVKPGNILVASAEDRAGAGHVFLCDFGITKNLSSAGHTRRGHVVGTANYMAPEQCRGEPVDGRTDLYALGCVLYECLTGNVPYERESEEAVMFGHVHLPPPTLSTARPDLPAALDDVVAAALAKRPEDRFSTCSELIVACRAVLDGKVPPLPLPPADTRAYEEGETRQSVEAGGAPPPPWGAILDAGAPPPPVTAPTPPPPVDVASAMAASSRPTVAEGGAGILERGPGGPHEGTALDGGVPPRGATVLDQGGPASGATVLDQGVPPSAGGTVADVGGWEGGVRLDVRPRPPRRPWWRHPATLTAAAVLLVLAAGGAVLAMTVLGKDHTPPATRVLGAPDPLVNTSTATIRFTSSEAGTFECSLDGGPRQTCRSPRVLRELRDGRHEFSVVATDDAGNVDTTPSRVDWTIDTTPPSTQITDGPRFDDATPDASFRIQASGNPAVIECTLDGGAEEPCGLHPTFRGLAPGRHDLEVRGLDAAGNLEASPSTFRWRTPTDDEIALLDAIDSGDVGISSCLPDSSPLFDNATAAVICDSTGGLHPFLSFLRFATNDELSAAIKSDQRAFGGPGECPSSVDFTFWGFDDNSDDRVDPSEKVGDYLCYHVQGDSWLDWTDPRLEMLGEVSVSGTHDLQLETWWHNHAARR